jgi:tRNA modification GTPase
MAARYWARRAAAARAATALFSTAPPPRDTMTTIFALSTGVGRAALAVIRLSGPGADAALAALLPPGAPLPPPRVATRARLAAPGSRAPLDDALALRFPGPASATGEDVVELHLHGGRAVVAAAAAALGALPGLRPALPGEFTARAHAAGKLDLAQVEGLADLLAAETEAQRAQALAAAGGAASAAAARWRAALLAALARLEAAIDYGEEESLGSGIAANALESLEPLRAELAGHLAAGARAELVRAGARVALVGAPNAGKSSLLNALAGRDAAITSPAPGTTRDVLEVGLDVGGFAARLTDAAGIRAAGDAVEAEGVRRARGAAAAAHVLLAVREAGGAGAWELGGAEGGGGEGESESDNSQRPIVRVLSKADLVPGGPAAAAAAARAVGADVAVSCVTGEGLDALTAALGAAVRRAVEGGAGAGAGPPLLHRERHRRHVADAGAALARAAASGGGAVEIAAEEVRLAARSLGCVAGVGEIGVEDVLTELMAEFCVGK